MYQIPEQLMALNKANLEATTQFAGIALEATERVFKVQLKMAKRTPYDGVHKAKWLAAATDLRDLAQLTKAFAQPHLENATSQTVHEVRRKAA